MHRPQDRHETRAPARIIWITTDHMRWDCIGAYGVLPVHTPNLDRLVAGGVSLNQCYVQSPLCMPSRASFMTGLYPSQTGVTNNGHELPADFDPVAPRCFARLGYETVHIGKLHLQCHENHDLDDQPRRHFGFDRFVLSESRGCYDDAWMNWLRCRYPDHVETFTLTRPTDPRRQEKVGTVLDAPIEATHCAFVTDIANQMLRAYSSRRLFMHLGFHHPHPPLNPTREAFAPYEEAELRPGRWSKEEWADKPEPLAGMLRSRSDWTDQELLEYRRHFFAMVSELDHAVGQLLDDLAEQDLLDDTLIVFSSDHGDLCGDHRMTHKGPSFFDELMRVPCVLHWPAGLGSSRRDIDSLLEKSDLLPTLIELSGGTPPAEMAGRSFAEALLNQAAPEARASVLAMHAPDWVMLRTTEAKYLRFGSHGNEVLFDLHAAPSETRNVAVDQPALLSRMREELLSRLLAATASPRKRTRLF